MVIIYKEIHQNGLYLLIFMRLLNFETHQQNTGVSVTDIASFAIVFPVQLGKSIISVIFLGPMGSASSMVFIIFFPAMVSNIFMLSSAFPKRVEREEALKLIIGTSSAPNLTSRSAASKAFLNVQKEPQTATPTRSPFSVSHKVLTPFIPVKCSLWFFLLFFRLLQAQFFREETEPISP